MAIIQGNIFWRFIKTANLCIKIDDQFANRGGGGHNMCDFLGSFLISYNFHISL